MWPGQTGANHQCPHACGRLKQSVTTSHAATVQPGMSRGVRRRAQSTQITKKMRPLRNALVQQLLANGDRKVQTSKPAPAASFQYRIRELPAQRSPPTAIVRLEGHCITERNRDRAVRVNEPRLTYRRSYKAIDRNPCPGLKVKKVAQSPATSASRLRSCD